MKAPMSYHKIEYNRTSWSQKNYTRILLAGKSLIADISGALFWPSEKTLIISDPSIKNDKIAPQEALSLRTHETRATLIRISDTAKYYDAKRIIILGCHDKGITDNTILDEESKQRLKDIQNTYDCFWVLNDQSPDYLKDLNAIIADHFILNGITFRHKPTLAPIAREIAGYMNPIAKQKSETKAIGQRCFVSNNARLIMPTFGNCGQAQNILSKSFDPIFSMGNQYVWIIGTNDVHPIAARLLEED